jgi:hypothetical protein
MWRNEEEIPKVLFPKINKIGTVKPIKGPATYQGHGFFNNSIMLSISIYIVFVNTKLNK